MLNSISRSIKTISPNSIITIKQMAVITYDNSTYVYSGKIVKQELRDYFWNTFGLREGEFSIVYVDEEGDHITLDTKDDYEIVSAVEQSTDTLNLIVTSTKKEAHVMEPPVEITVPQSVSEIQPEIVKVEEPTESQEDQNRRFAEMKRQADIKIKKEHQEAQRRDREELAVKKNADAERKRLEKQAQKADAERLKQEKIQAKKAQDQARDRQRKEKDQQRCKQRQEKERARKEKQQVKVEKKVETKEKSNENPFKDQTVELKDVKQDNKKEEKKKVEKKEKQVTPQKIGEWDITKLNEVVEQRLRNLLPIMKEEIENKFKASTSIHQEDHFTIDLQHPTTIQDVTRMKNQAFEKVKAFYQAEHLKINEKLKEEKVRAAAEERSRKKKEEREAKQLKEKQEQIANRRPE